MKNDLALFKSGNYPYYIKDDPYTVLAKYYDAIMVDIYYDSWADYLSDLIYSYGQSPELILDLGCGTGNMIVPLKEMEYEVHGLDSSKAMLKVARSKMKDFNPEVHFYQKSMCNFHLPKQYDVIFCFHNGLNCLVHSKDLQNTFASVSQSLNAKGLFIFDLTSELNVRKNYDQKTEYENFKEFAYLWTNQYHKEQNLLISTIDILVKQDRKAYREEHPQRIYSIDDIKNLLYPYFKKVDVYHCFSFDPPKKTSLAYHFVCSKD